MKAISKTAEKIFRAAIAKVEEQKAAGADCPWRIGESGGAFMPLCVEHVGSVKFGNSEKALPVLSFAHYYEQNGDAMRDPDITMLDAPGGLLTALQESERRRDCPVYAETEYFKVRGFLKGTTHLEFKRLDLLDELNRIAGGGALKHSNQAAKEWQAAGGAAVATREACHV